jgi:hypothetical protein
VCVLLRLLVILLTNAVPLVGVLERGWSAPTVLALSWCETVLQGTLNCVRIVLHRHWTDVAGHWRAGAGAVQIGAYGLPRTKGARAALESLAAVLGGNADALPAAPPRLFALFARKAGKDADAEWRDVLAQEERKRAAWNAPRRGITAGEGSA